MQVLMVLWVTNRKVYGAHKLWKAAQRAGHEIGRDQVARLMRELAIEGVSRRRKKVFTTRQDPDALRAPDLVNRNFTADRPDALWVTDLTYVPTRSGMAYVCFIVDAFSRRIVGWRVASNMKTEMVLDALEMARRSRGGRRLVGLVTHSDAGSQFTSVRFTERLDEIGARPSIGTVADSYDNALAETTNGLYKTELVYGPDSTGWDDVDELELATLSWVHWFNEDRLHCSLRRRPARRVRDRVLRCADDHQRSALKPNPRASNKPRAIHNSRGATPAEIPASHLVQDKDVSVRQDTRSFRWALLLGVVAALIGLAVTLTDGDENSGTVVGAITVTFIIAGLLWIFAHRGHRWPSWVVLAQAVVGLISVLAGTLLNSPDLRLVSALFDALAVVVLLRGWSTRGSTSLDAPV